MATITLTVSAVLAIIVGILVIAFPKLLRWALGLYLILFGVLQLTGGFLGLSP